MAELIAPLPEMVLQPGMSVVFEAIDPASGAAVTGVKVTEVSIFGDTTSGGDTSGGSVNVTDVAPEFVPIPLGDLNP